MQLWEGLLRGEFHERAGGEGESWGGGTLELVARGGTMRKCPLPCCMQAGTMDT